MRKIYDEIKDEYKFGRFKQIKAKHLDLYRMVNKKRIPERKGIVAFWRNIMEEWNRAHPEAKYATWKAISVAYSRILNNRQIKLGKPREGTLTMSFARVIDSYLESSKKEAQNERKHKTKKQK